MEPPSGLLALSDKVAAFEVSPRCVVGFDGFIDTLLTAVDTRDSPEIYTPIATITDFGERIIAAAGHSCNIELVPQKVKLGGNGPIMASALIKLGCRISYVGAIGSLGNIPEVFHYFSQQCEETFPLAPPGETNALEFRDGKVMLGNLSSIHGIDWNTVYDRVGRDSLMELLDSCDLFASVNWTMLPYMTAIWEGLLKEIAPYLSQKQRWLFVDLADPKKRPVEDLKQALSTLSKFSSSFQVVLGANESEAKQLLALYGLSAGNSLISTAETLQKTTEYSQVVVHTHKEAAASDGVSVASVAVPFCETPVLTTGAGDNFNAGYIWGILNGLEINQALTTGVASAGYYIRNGKSGTRDNLAAFLHDWAGTLRFY